LAVPDDLYNGYFKSAYMTSGARIFSSSWGAQELAYASTSQDADKFAYDFPDFLPIFAAGNYGESGRF
jgi:hypothetical protein